MYQSVRYVRQYTLYSSIYSIQYTAYGIYSIHSIKYTVYTVYGIHSIQYTVYCILRSEMEGNRQDEWGSE